MYGIIIKKGKQEKKKPYHFLWVSLYLDKCTLFFFFSKLGTHDKEVNHVWCCGARRQIKKLCSFFFFSWLCWWVFCTSFFFFLRWHALEVARMPWPQHLYGAAFDLSTHLYSRVASLVFCLFLTFFCSSLETPFSVFSLSKWIGSSHTSA